MSRTKYQIPTWLVSQFSFSIDVEFHKPIAINSKYQISTWLVSQFSLSSQLMLNFINQWLCVQNIRYQLGWLPNTHLLSNLLKPIAIWLNLNHNVRSQHGWFHNSQHCQVDIEFHKLKPNCHMFELDRIKITLNSSPPNCHIFELNWNFKLLNQSHVDATCSYLPTQKFNLKL